MPHMGLVGRNEATGQHESGRAAVVHCQPRHAAVTELSKAHTMAAELPVDVVDVVGGRGTGGGGAGGELPPVLGWPGR